MTSSEHEGPGGRAARRRLPELVGMDAVAAALGVTERHVRRLVTERRIPYVRVGHFIRFDPEELARWVDEHRVEPRREAPARRRR